MNSNILETGGYYHVYNRGVDKRNIFEDEIDFQRFYHSMYLFNDKNYSNPGNQPYFNETLLAAHDRIQDERDPLVSVVSYCLLDNHFHFFLKQVQDGGIAKFLQKLGAGYTKYFNRKQDRTGSLFETTYKRVAINDDLQFMHLSRYIHLNSLNDKIFNWRQGLIDDWDTASRELEDFRWSSHNTFLGKEQELPVIDLNEVRKLFADSNEYMDFLKEWSTRELPCPLCTSDVLKGHRL